MATTKPVNGQPSSPVGSRADYIAAVARVENDTAIVLDGLGSLRELWLFLRALERRGHIGADDAVAAQRDLARIRRALEAAHGRLKAERGDPLGTGA